MPRSPSPKKRKNGRRRRRSPARTMYEPPMFPVMSTAIDPYFMSLLNVNTQLTQQIHVLQERIRQHELKPELAPAKVVEPVVDLGLLEKPGFAPAKVPDDTDLELLENIAGMPLAVQERMNSTLEIYTKKCKDESKEALMSDYVLRGKNFMEQVNAFDGTKATKEYIRDMFNKLDKGFTEFNHLDIQVRKDMCRKEMGTSTDTTTSPMLPSVNIGSRTDAKEIAIPQLNYNYTFRCNGEEASETMVEWMKREPHYANATDKKCVIVDKSLICISGTASGKVFTEGQKLSNEFQVFLVDATTGWACIGRKRCESVWDIVQKYSTKTAQVVFEALKTSISASSKVLKFVEDKFIKLPGGVISKVAYKILDTIKTSHKHLFTLQFKAFLMLLALTGSGIILRSAIPSLINQLGLQPLAEAASLANTSAVLLKHKDVIPAVVLATTNVSLVKNNTFAVNALLGSSLAMITQLNTSVPFLQYIAGALHIPPKFTDEQNNQLDTALSNLTNVTTVPRSGSEESFILPPPPPPNPPANFGDLANNVFRNATKDVQVSPKPLPTGVLEECYEWLKEKIGEDNLNMIIPLINAAQVLYIGVLLAGGNWNVLFALNEFIPKLAGLPAHMYTIIKTIRSNPTIQTAIQNTLANAAAAATAAATAAAPAAAAALAAAAAPAAAPPAALAAAPRLARAVAELISNLGSYWH